jgi:hypothetical protein
MKTAKPHIEYTGNSEIRIVEGWCCKTCNRFWGDSQHMANWCCCTHAPCKECGQSTDKGRVMCDGCWQKEVRKRFEKMEAKPYDGSAVVTYDDDRYFFDQDELLEWLADTGDGEACNTDDVMLVFAKSRRPSWRHDVSELVCDDLDPDSEWDTSEIDNQIAAWVDANAPTVYFSTKVRVDVASLKSLIDDERAAGRWPE